MPDHIALRSTPTAQADELGVDREARLIRGVSIIEEGRALGHPFDIDATTVDQVVTMGNARSQGVKARLSHPDACNDGTGRELGRWRNFRQEVSQGRTRAVADFHGLEAAHRAPDGDLVGWFLDVAEEDPALVGISITAKGEATPRLDEDGEQAVDGDGAPLRPVLRLDALTGADVVDEPAANRSGLFASAASLAAQAIDHALEAAGELVEVTVDGLADLGAASPLVHTLANELELHGNGITLSTTHNAADLDRAAGFLNRYLDRRGIGHPVIDADAISRIVTRLQETPAMPETPPNVQATASANEPATAATTLATPAAPAAPAAPATDPNVAAEATTAERERITSIQALGAMFPGEELEPVLEAAVTGGVTLAEANRRVLAHLGERQAGTGGQGQVLVGDGAREKLRRQGVDAILLNRNVALEGDDVESRTREANRNGLRGLGPKQLARLCLREAGMGNVERMSDEDVFNRSFGAFALDSGVGHSTGDFPLILADSANKAMIAGYNLAPVTWDAWCRVGSLSDFKTNSRLRLSEAPLLDERPEGLPAAQGTFNEQREQITLDNYAKAVSYTRQMFINDDLGAFMDLAQRMGAGANYSVERGVYVSLTLNTRTGPTMSDSNTLIHASHNNLASDAGVPSQSRLEDAVADMMAQTGIGQDGSDVTLGVAPEIWIAAPKVAMQIEKIIRSQFAGSDTRRDPQLASLATTRVIAAPLLIGLGATTDYWAVAPQTLAPSYEVAFLNGQRTPRSATVNHPTVDGTTIVISNDWGIFPTGGWQGIWRNAGA